MLKRMDHDLEKTFVPAKVEGWPVVTVLGLRQHAPETYVRVLHSQGGVRVGISSLRSVVLQHITGHSVGSTTIQLTKSERLSGRPKCLWVLPSAPIAANTIDDGVARLETYLSTPGQSSAFILPIKLQHGSDDPEANYLICLRNNDNHELEEDPRRKYWTKARQFIWPQHASSKVVWAACLIMAISVLSLAYFGPSISMKKITNEPLIALPT